MSAVPLGVPHEASAAVRDTVRGGEASVVTGLSYPWPDLRFPALARGPDHAERSS